MIRLAVILLALISVSVSAEIIAPSNRVDWAVGSTVGSQSGKTYRTTLLNVVSGFGADNTGATASHTNIQAAIDTATAGDVVYLPNGVYKLTSALSLNKSNVTLRGESTNAVLHMAGSQSIGLNVGHDAVSYSQAVFHRVASGATKGSTNLTLFNVDDGFGGTIEPGDSFRISSTMEGSPTWAYIANFGYTNTFSQVLVCHTITSTNITITVPLVFDFTNAPILQSLNRYGAVGDSERMVSGIGIENLTITTTNGGTTGSGSTLMAAAMLRDSWITNVCLYYANNFFLDISSCANLQVEGCILSSVFNAGPNHSGIRIASSSGLLVQNNILVNGLFPALEVWSASVVGSAFFANYFTNVGSAYAFNYHNTHHGMNLIEANVMSEGNWFPDGYFGSISHETVFRNQFRKADLKRWTTHIQIVGNVIGSSAAPEPADDLITRGLPNIGNTSYISNSPPAYWNWPGKYYIPSDAVQRTNGHFALTNSGTGSTIPGVFTNLVTQTEGGGNTTIIFQDASNTNKYWSPGNAPLYASTITSSNMTLNQSISWTNGWVVYAAGTGAYQQRQFGDKTNCVVHGNLMFTNSAGVLEWDSGIADQNVPDSILYAAAPSWWGTNRWPAIDAEVSPYVTPIPAEDRYYGRLYESQPTTGARGPRIRGIRLRP